MTIRRFPRSRQSALPYPATLDLSFIGRDTLDPRITFTRADATTCATYFDAAGVLQTAAVNVPRFDYNPSTLAARGFLIEEQRTNSIRNNTMQGAVAGIPGTAPTNWTTYGSTNGLTQEIVGIGIEDGINYIDIKLTGTTIASVTGVTFALFEATTQVAASSTQTWTGSVYYRIVAGSTTGLSLLSLTVEERTSTGGFLANTNQSILSVSNADLRTQRFAVTRLFTQATTARASLRTIFNAASGVAIDITLRIGLPQLELGAFATSVIPTSTAAVTREADAASITTLTPWFNASSGTLFAEFSAPASGIRTMVDLNDTTATESIRLRTDGTNPFFTVTDGTDQANIDAGTVASNTVYKFAGAYAANDFATCINGGTVQTHSSGTLPTITQMLLGSDASGNALNGHLRRLAFYPTRLSNTDLQAITA